MTITRKFGEGSIVFELTANEIEEAYRIRKKQFLRIDIKDLLDDWKDYGELS